jgi:hypothetical protein
VTQTLIERVAAAVIERNGPTTLNDLGRYFPGYDRRALRRALQAACAKKVIHLAQRGRGGIKGEVDFEGIWLPGPARAAPRPRAVASVFHLGGAFE